MENKKVAGVLCVVLLILIGSVSAITGSIGNARMILRAETGDVIDKYILVKNVNNVSVNISLSASGDLAEYIDILDNSFVLEPDSEMRARFVVNVKKVGTTEGTIDVKFAPVDGKNGVGLMSTVIVIAEKGSFWDWGSGDEDEGNVDVNNSVTGGAVGVSDGANFAVVFLMIAIFILLVLIIIFFILLGKEKTRSVVSKRRKGK
ncbi:MAG: hypothetical protein V1889_03240 [archaeon]